MAFQNTKGIKPFEEQVWLARPSVYQDSMDYVWEAYKTNWMTTAGANVDAVEEEVASLVGCKYAVALSSGTAALHMAVKLAGEKIYGKPKIGVGALDNHH